MSSDKVSQNVTLAELSNPPKQYSYKINQWHVVSLSFIVVFVLLWLILYTFHPSVILSDNDYVSDWNVAASSGSGQAGRDNKILSDKGRLTIFLWSFILALVCAIVVYFILTKRN